MIRAAAREAEVERIFVNAAIKKAVCREAGSDRGLAATRCGPCGGTITISTSACAARPARPTASRRSRRSIRRRLRARARLVVHRRGAQPAQGAAQAAVGAEDGGPAGRLPAGAARAVIIRGSPLPSLPARGGGKGGGEHLTMTEAKSEDDAVEHSEHEGHDHEHDGDDRCGVGGGAVRRRFHQHRNPQPQQIEAIQAGNDTEQR